MNFTIISSVRTEFQDMLQKKITISRTFIYSMRHFTHIMSQTASQHLNYYNEIF